jgi:hypothetical protein
MLLRKHSEMGVVEPLIREEYHKLQRCNIGTVGAFKHRHPYR